MVLADGFEAVAAAALGLLLLLACWWCSWLAPLLGWLAPLSLFCCCWLPGECWLGLWSCSPLLLLAGMVMLLVCLVCVGCECCGLGNGWGLHLCWLLVGMGWNGLEWVGMVH